MESQDCLSDNKCLLLWKKHIIITNITIIKSMAATRGMAGITIITTNTIITTTMPLLRIA